MRGKEKERGGECVAALSISDNVYARQNAFTYCFVASNGRYSPPRILSARAGGHLFCSARVMHAG